MQPENLEPLSITAYPLSSTVPEIRAGVVERDWMDQTGHQFAYRCLPLNIANTLGWQIISDTEFTLTWTGGPLKEDLVITPVGESGHTLGLSHFGSGIFTFHTHVLFRTSPGVSLLATGPLNDPLHGLAPLSGVVETEWAPFPFTMNWKVTAPTTEPLRFPKGHPICQIIPIGLGGIEEMVCDVKLMESDPELNAHYHMWSESRGKFLSEPRPPEAWQKHYFTGKMPTGEKAPVPHRTRLRLNQFPGLTLNAR